MRLALWEIAIIVSRGLFFPVEMVESKIRVFDYLASDYDAWFEEEGRLIFASLAGLKQSNGRTT